jgi:hypothetical protein
MAATRAENNQPTASIPALGFGLRAWCKSVIETSHAPASPSINKKQALTFAARQQRQNVHSGFIFERRKFGQ